MTSDQTSTSLYHQEVSCPNCSATIKYYDWEGSAYFGCSSCHTYFHYENFQTEILKTFPHSDSIKPALDFGAEGVIDGKKFIVVGVIRKRDNNEGVTWDEYMLLDKAEESYYVLAYTEGDWTFVWKSERQDFKVMNTMVNGDDFVAMQYDPYRKYNEYTRYQFETLYAAGEFDTNIIADDGNMRVAEYLAFPDLLISETNDEGRIWYRGRVVPYKKVKNAFKNINAVGTEYDDEDEDKSGYIFKVAGLLTVLMILAMVFLGFSNSSEEIYNRGFLTERDSSSWGKYTPIDAGTMRVNGPTALNVNLKGNIDNEWLEVAVTMVNKKTGKTYEFTKVLEYYHGYEGGESWSEGSGDKNAVLSAVESGTYQVNIYPFSDYGKVYSLQMRVQQNTFLFSNLFLVLLLIWAVPIYLMIKKSSEESKSEYY